MRHVFAPQSLSRRRVIHVNCTAQIHVTLAFLGACARRRPPPSWPRSPHAQRRADLIKKSHGRMVFVTSVAGRTPCPGLSAYAASKVAAALLPRWSVAQKDARQWGLEGFAQSMRLEISPWDCSVSIIGALRAAIACTLSSGRARRARILPHGHHPGAARAGQRGGSLGAPPAERQGSALPRPACVPPCPDRCPADDYGPDYVDKVRRTQKRIQDNAGDPQIVRALMS